MITLDGHRFDDKLLTFREYLYERQLISLNLSKKVEKLTYFLFVIATKAVKGRRQLVTHNSH